MTTTNTRAILIALSLLFAVAACDPDDPSGGDRDAGPPDAGDTDAGGADSGEPECPLFGQIPVPEECNAFDDDCDGVVDEGVCDDPCDVFDEP